jgi:cyclopropane-fatty-acyl-phospholipid synthase
MTFLLIGTTKHTRFKPRFHSFTYPILMLESDITTLNKKNAYFPFFGYNKKGILSIHDSDFLHKNNKNIQEKIHALTSQLPNTKEIDSIRLIAIPKLFNKGFRPVSFYLCYTASKNLIALIAEVTNTYGESHIYLMKKTENNTFKTEKNFHVSPFFKEEGDYFFNIKQTERKSEIHIRYSVNKTPVFYANFIAKKKPFNRRNILLSLCVLPLNAILIFPKILYQAFIINMIKKIPARSKPIPPKVNTLRHMPLSSLQKIIFSKIKKMASSITSESLLITLPDSSVHMLGSQKEGPLQLTINNTQFFTDIAFSGEIGLGESYMKRRWDSNSLVELLQFFIRNESHFEKITNGVFITKFINAFLHSIRKNSVKKSKSNIEEHYDLGNRFYSVFLDKSMMYSSAIFSDTHTTLEDAQENKIATLINELEAKAGDHILEIGSGWGEVAIQLAKKTNCFVTTVTLSENQYAFVSERIKKENLDHLVTIKLQDYRHITDTFDGIISVEMIEAVGHKYLPEYFSTCNRLLKSGGRFVLQGITYPCDKYDEYRKRSDFIRKHIFPGGHLPSLEIMDTIIQTKTDLTEIKRRNIADSYAKTLFEWRKRFLNKKETIENLGFSETFIRKWEYYFAYCEAGFSSNYLGCYQLTYKKREGCHD